MSRTKKSVWMTPLTLLILLFHMIPVYITFIASITKLGDLKSYWLPPKYFFIENYSTALTSGNLPAAFKNTILITVISVFLIVLLGAFAAYPLARYESKLNSFVMFAIISLMMIPPLSLLVPLYKFMRTIDGINTLWGIILLHVAFQLPLSIFLFKNFIQTIPKELDEAATLDGCNIFQVFYRIILPNIKPVIATIIILTGVNVWNDYQFSLYFLQSSELSVVTLSISSFFSQGDMNINVAAAAAMLAIIPVTIAFLFLQKYFIKGMVDSAIK
ncbi:carbohydrate ABC transporter permease [Bacillaceae bacterium Marseille-Q3522]|nr:carbohydrate ABC transporter permease [Bacillaceae bacterium Marseille-Q3522]